VVLRFRSSQAPVVVAPHPVASASVRLRIFTEPQLGATYDQQLTFARASERLGFDAYFRSDHYLTMNDDGRPGPTDAWATLAALGRETATIRLGTLVTPITFRWPGQLAIQVAQADAMSSGRVELGIGAGWYAAEHAAYGIPFPATGTRFEMLDEQLAIITGLWATPDGKRFDYDGIHYRIADSPGLPKPVQQPRPPIIVGGVGTRRTPRLAATYADEFNVPFMPLDGFRPACQRVRAACQAVGRDPASLRYTFAAETCVGTDEAEYRRRAAAIGRDPDQMRAGGASGTVAEVVDRLNAWAAAGAEAAYLQIIDFDDLDQLELIAAEIAPHV
jgi:F420-dependent oxidoreductase-like protein